MRNWLIAMAVSGTLTGLSHTASAQEIKRTGSGFAKSECFASWGSCGGLGPETCSGPDCSVSVSGNGTHIQGMDGEAVLNMSESNISVSGRASFTPPSPCSPNAGAPYYTADGNQSIYADVPNGTSIQITINASLSGTGGGGATWSDAKSGGGGTSGTTSFNTVAGPGKITVGGLDYYLINSIRVNGIAKTEQWSCSGHSQSFSASVSLQFKVIGKVMRKSSGDGQSNFVAHGMKLWVEKGLENKAPDAVVSFLSRRGGRARCNQIISQGCLGFKDFV